MLKCKPLSVAVRLPRWLLCSIVAVSECRLLAANPSLPCYRSCDDCTFNTLNYYILLPSTMQLLLRTPRAAEPSRTYLFNDIFITMFAFYRCLLRNNNAGPFESVFICNWKIRRSLCRVFAVLANHRFFTEPVSCLAVNSRQSHVCFEHYGSAGVRTAVNPPLFRSTQSVLFSCEKSPKVSSVDSVIGGLLTLAQFI